MLVICGKVFDRSGGHERYSASQVMARHPKWTEFIRSIENWDKVEFGTLTVDDCTPLPNVVLDSLNASGLGGDERTGCGRFRCNQRAGNKHRCCQCHVFNLAASFDCRLAGGKDLASHCPVVSFWGIRAWFNRILTRAMTMMSTPFYGRSYKPSASLRPWHYGA